MSVSYGEFGKVRDFKFPLLLWPWNCLSSIRMFLNVYWYYHRSWWAVVKSILKVYRWFCTDFTSFIVWIYHWRCQSWILGFIQLILFVMGSGGLTHQLRSIYHTLSKQIVLQLDVWGLILIYRSSVHRRASIFAIAMLTSQFQ